MGLAEPKVPPTLWVLLFMAGRGKGIISPTLSPVCPPMPNEPCRKPYFTSGIMQTKSKSAFVFHESKVLCVHLKICTIVYVFTLNN